MIIPLSLFQSALALKDHASRNVALVALGLTLAACNPNLDFDERHTKPLSNATKTRLENLKMDASAPMVVRIYKEEAELEVWKWRKLDRKYALFQIYDICAYSGKLGPKIKEGDRQAPEGFYSIVPGLMNPKSNYYLAFNLGFPNEFDRAHKRTGSHLMVHGSCSSRGCYAMEDDQIEEIYQLGRESFSAGQKSFQVQAFPFRMTDANLARHSDSPHAGFWRMLKEGSDHFEAMKQPPKVNVCEKRYIFNAVAAEGEDFIADEACPVYAVPESIGRKVAKYRGEAYVPQTPIAAFPVAQSALAAPITAKPLPVGPATVDPTTGALASPVTNPQEAFSVRETQVPQPFEAEAEPTGFFTKLFRR